MRHRDRALEQGRDPNVRSHRSRYANTGQVIRSDAPALETALGHEDGAMTGGSDPVEGEARSVDIGGQPMREKTGRPDPGTTRETIDGLDETEEALRRSAEDRPVGRDDD